MALPERRPSGGVPAAAAPPPGCDLSIVIPVYNEEGNVASLCRRLQAVLASLPLASEVVLVDDGSRDGTAAEIRSVAILFPGVRAVRLRRNFGQTAALAAGFDHARGAIVITLDADLQNPPEEIPRVLAKMEEGYDMVSGWRVDRRDPFLRRVFPSRIANRLIGWVTGTRLHDYGCSLKAYRRDILEGIRIHGDMHRFLPAFAGAVGARIAELPVRHAPRRNGKSKYGLLRTLIVMVDIVSIRFLLPFSFKPLKIFGLLGLISFGSGTLINMYLAWVRLIQGHGLSDRPLLLLGVLLTITGVQLMVLGILAELQTRALLDAGHRTTYAVLERIGFPAEDGAGAPARVPAHAAGPGAGA